jgi:hypothetical protein
VYNGWLVNVNCNNGVIFVDVFQLPVQIYQYPNSGCDVSYDVADYLHFTRNFARQINVVNREVDLEYENGPMVCRFDQKTYDFLHQLYVLDGEQLYRDGGSWNIQYILQ